MTRRKLVTLEDHREAIEQAIDVDGPYTQRVIASVLKSSTVACGIETTHELIDEFDLEDRGFNKDGQEDEPAA